MVRQTGRDLQSLWLTSWFGFNNNNNSYSNKRQQDASAVDAGVYTLQQPHKFPLQLDVYSGNCSFDYQQHELPSGHYQNQQQQQLHRATAAIAQEQSTLSIRNPRQRTSKRQQWRFLTNSSDIYETKFIESSAAQTMDDMVYQCSNQNSIYVLNAGYNPTTYGDFGATGREMNGRRTTSNSIGATYSSGACSLQHKFKTFGTANGNSSATQAVAAAATTTTTATVTNLTAAATATTNYANPVATSMSTAMCSPATAALQKLFIGDVCQNVSHRNQQQSHSNSNGNGNNNCPVGSHNNSCLSAAAAASQRRGCDSHEGATVTGQHEKGGGGLGAGALPLFGAVANRKKCTNVKSTLIAKKTKFLKFLEEEKWRSSQQLTPDDAVDCGATQQQQQQPHSRANSNEADPTFTSMSMSAAASAASSFAGHSSSKNKNSKNHNSNNSQEAAAGAEQQQNKLNNWSMHNDNNNKLANYTQQQQQRERELYKQANRSSSYELYQEAADLLGLSCSLCDNCRCLDCQSGYFDCADDDDECYSEQSLMDEYDEYDDGYSYEDQMLLLASVHHQPSQTNQPDEQLQQQHQQQQEQELDVCYAIDCEQNCIKGETESESEHHRLAIDVDLINATSTQVLENCVTFNDLSLLDAEQQLQTFT